MALSDANHGLLAALTRIHFVMWLPIYLLACLLDMWPTPFYLSCSLATYDHEIWHSNSSNIRNRCGFLSSSLDVISCVANMVLHQRPSNPISIRSIMLVTIIKRWNAQISNLTAFRVITLGTHCTVQNLHNRITSLTWLPQNNIQSCCEHST